MLLCHSHVLRPALCQGQKWFETLEAKGFLCDVPAEELPMFADTKGGLVLSRTAVDPALVRRQGWRTSLDVANATAVAAGGPHRARTFSLADPTHSEGLCLGKPHWAPTPA